MMKNQIPESGVCRNDQILCGNVQSSDVGICAVSQQSGAASNCFYRVPRFVPRR
jgi:hypothetical protein